MGMEIVGAAASELVSHAVSSGGEPLAGMTAPPAADDFFEGSEKRLEVHAAWEDEREAPAAGRLLRAERSAAGGLRSIPRAQVDAFLGEAGCEVLSVSHNAVYDAYVLSESSLFVAADRMVIKTCGQTPLIDALPSVKRCAAALGMALTYVKYSRASYLNGDRQQPGHRCFEREESVRLRELTAGMGMRSRQYMLGEQGADPEVSGIELPYQVLITIA